MPHPNDSQDAAIPVLNEVLVQGDPAQARDTAPEPADGFGAEPDEGALLEDEAAAPIDLPMSDAIVSAKPARDVKAVESVQTEVAAAVVGSTAAALQAAAASPEAGSPAAESPVAAPASAAPAAQTHVAPEPSRPADVPPHVSAPAVPTASAVPAAPTAAHPTPPPAASPGITDYDANLIAERLRGRFASYLTGEGRSLIEARCRDAFQEHTSRLVSQITREVSMALEMELTGWVREAIREELKHRGG
ncbi:DUF2486 family protein [Paraburkholderia jirisanensis]